MAADNVGLTRGFFQYFVEDTVPDGTQPVLQIIEAREMQNAAAWRARLSDGMFHYSSTCFPRSLEKRFVDDGLSDTQAVIKIRTYVRSTPNGGKPMMAIHDYEVISLTEPVIGHPQAHTGRADDFRGIQNLPPIGATNGAQPRAQKRAGSPLPNNAPPKRQSTAATNGVTNISLITPYINRWRICGVVSCKEEPREIKTSRGPSKVFSFIVTDQGGFAIKVTAFGAEAEKFSPLVYNGQAFYIAGSGQSTIRPANKRFNTTGHDYEITLNRDCEVNICNDVHIPEPKMKLHIVPLNKVAEHKDECVDVLAVIDRAEEVVSVTQKSTGKELSRRNIYLLDQTGTEVQFTMWGDQAVNFDTNHVGEVVGIKGGLVREFMGGFSLTAGGNSQMEFNPEGDLTNELYVWHRETKPTISINSISTGVGGSEAFERDLRCIGPAGIAKLGLGSEKPVYFNVIGSVISVKKENALYQACPVDGCKKKVTADDNQFRCDKCGKSYGTFKYVLMLQVELTDFTGTTWVTIFEEKAAAFLGVSAETLGRLQLDDGAQYEAIFQAIMFKPYNIRLRARYETYNDVQRQKFDVMDIKPVPYDKYLAALSHSLQKMGLN